MACRTRPAAQARNLALRTTFEERFPDLTDFAVWGQVAPLLCWPMPTPVADHAKSMPDLRAWHDRILDETRFSPTQGDQLARRTA
jgi:hypothetical protein